MSASNLYIVSNIPGFKECVNEEAQTSLKVSKVEYTSKNNQFYKVIRYDKSVLTHDMVSITGICRSIIVNSANKVVSFAPPKCIKTDDFISKYQEPIADSLIAEEFVEGTMMNVFWDETAGLDGAWEIATRNSVGGDISVDKTSNTTRFRKLFIEALKQSNLELNSLERRYCYSFVLQHPENKIVVPVVKPQLYLIELYEIVNTEDFTTNVFPLDKNVVEKMKDFQGTNVRFPEKYTGWKTLDDLKDKYASMNTPYDIMGVVIRDPTTNERCKLRNPNYEFCKNIKGVEAKRQYQYLCLKKEGKMKAFLEEMPAYRTDFSKFRKNVHDFTKQLYSNYISCYIKKELHGSEYPVEYRQHMFELHKQYTTVLKPKGEHINFKVVIDYVNNLDPGRLFYTLSAPMRKRREDISVQEKNE
jgi:hypothetical protein